MELSFPGAKMTWNFRSLELSLHNFCSLELSFPGTFDPMSQSNVKLSLPTRIISDLYRLWKSLWQSFSKWLLKLNVIECGVMTVGRAVSPMCDRYVVSESTDSTEVLTSCGPFYQPAPSAGMLWWFQLLRFLLRITSLGRIKHVGLQASTGCVQGMTSCDPGSTCVKLVATTIFGQGEWKFLAIFPSGS